MQNTRYMRYDLVWPPKRKLGDAITLYDTMIPCHNADRAIVARLPRPAARRRFGRRFTVRAASNVDLDRTSSLRRLLAQPGILLVRLLSVPTFFVLVTDWEGHACNVPSKTAPHSSNAGIGNVGLASPPPPQGPCCHDGLSARLIEQAGFDFAFMSGFCTAAARLGAPDTGLISYAEMADVGRNCHEATSRLPSERAATNCCRPRLFLRAFRPACVLFARLPSIWHHAFPPSPASLGPRSHRRRRHGVRQCGQREAHGGRVCGCGVCGHTDRRPAGAGGGGG